MNGAAMEELSVEPISTQHVDAEHPWPGLWPFTEDSEAYFNGRARETLELARLVRRDTLTVLNGQSGLGKSSLLMAGLFPLLRREEYLPVYVRLEHAEGSAPLGEQIFARLFRECEQEGVEAPARRAGEALWDYLHGADATFWSRKNRVVTPLFVIDQFEELFTLGRSAERDRFEEELAELVANRVPPSLAQRLVADPDAADAYDLEAIRYKIVLGIREDYVAALDSMKTRMPMNLQQRLRLTPMDGDQALDAVRKTGGDLVDDDAARTIVRFLSKGPGGVSYEERRELSDGEVDPALLSIVCYELNEKRLRLGRKQITTDLLEDKTQREILTSFYTRSFEHFDARSREWVRDIDPRVRAFVEEKLLTEDGLFRVSAPVTDAVRRPGVTIEALNKLIARRLLRTDVRARVQHVELTHDVLTDVVRESRDKRRLDEQQEQSRRALLAREADARQRAAQARRVTGIVALSAVVVIAVVAFAGAAAVRAQGQRNDVLRQKAEADSISHAEHDTAEARRLRMADSIANTNKALQLTVQRLEAAQENVRRQEQKAMVAAELADPFLRMSGSIVLHRIAQDSALRVTVRGVIDSASSIRAEAQRLSVRAEAIEAALCAEVQRLAAEPKPTAGADAKATTNVADPKVVAAARPDSATMAQLIARIRDGLRAKQLDEQLACAPAERDDKRSRP